MYDLIRLLRIRGEKVNHILNIQCILIIREVRREDNLGGNATKSALGYIELELRSVQACRTVKKSQERV
jgi:hypothetical protein